MLDAETLLIARDLSKTFTLHTQGDVRLPVFDGLDLSLKREQCLVLVGPSGAGKSSLIRCLYGNYLVQRGEVLVRHDGRMIDLAQATTRELLDVRLRTIGFVSQFLRVIPRVSTLDVVAEPLLADGCDEGVARDKAAAILTRLNIPDRLWSIAPATFSGGEQQRVNIARCFVADYPLLLLDEPTASLDVDNRKVVLDLIVEARKRGTGIVGIFHDPQDRAAVATDTLEMTAMDQAA